MSAPPISATGSGLSVPTPTVYDSTGKGNPRKDSNIESGGRHGVSLHHFIKMWPTPTQDSATERSSRYAQGGMPLTLAVAMWQTPVADDAVERSMNSLGTEPLITQVAIAEGKTDGALNPQWVEWLMGWPIGHSDLKPSETAKSLSAPPQHGECSEAIE